jgi:hypothetical protein
MTISQSIVVMTAFGLGLAFAPAAWATPGPLRQRLLEREFKAAALVVKAIRASSQRRVCRANAACGSSPLRWRTIYLLARVRRFSDVDVERARLLHHDPLHRARADAQRLANL